MFLVEVEVEVAGEQELSDRTRSWGFQRKIPEVKEKKQEEKTGTGSSRVMCVMRREDGEMNASSLCLEVAIGRSRFGMPLLGESAH